MFLDTFADKVTIATKMSENNSYDLTVIILISHSVI